MNLQTDRTLPRLADTPFLEKPPLSYWMSAAALEVYGDSAASARLPNLLYAGIVALAIGALAFAMDGAAAAVIAALVASTAITAFRVIVWLAPDACLLAGCAIALLGAYLGYRNRPGREKLFGYTLMHLGAAVGFMAKSAPGWIVPALTLLSLIVWERRWRELLRWELYAGFLAQALIIGPWIYAVTLTEHGAEALQTLFWNNLVGRFAHVAGPAALDYTTGHSNTPGKYFLELPVYLLPWTLLAVASLRLAWDRIREPGDRGTPWRFAIAASLPFLVLLSVAATARDIYSAPALLAFGPLIALWISELVNRHRPATRLDRFAIRGTFVLVAIIAVAFAAALSVFAAASGGGATVTFAINAVTVMTIAAIGLRFAARLRDSNDVLRSLAWIYTTYVAIVTLTGLAVFPTIDRWQDLPTLGRSIYDDARSHPLALLQPDETTIAMMDHRLRTPFATLDDRTLGPQRLVSDWFKAQGTSALVLVKLPGRTPGEISKLLGRFRRMPAPDDGIAASLSKERVARVVRYYELAEGRRYALLAPPAAGGG